jgi:hypothetical protein
MIHVTFRAHRGGFLIGEVVHLARPADAVMLFPE